MSTASNQQLVTAQELRRMPDAGPCELIEGKLRRLRYCGHLHGWIVVRVSCLLGDHVKKEGTRGAYLGRPGFLIARDPDTVRTPDVGLVRRARAPEDPDDFYPGPPDLAVEVVDWEDRIREVDEKAKAWLDAGAQMVWVVWPNNRTITVYRPGARPVTLRQQDTLEGGDVLPGFQCRVAEVFADE